MKAVVIRTFGDPEGLEVVDLPAPGPGPGQVLIAVEAIGVGGVDAVIRRGALAAYGFREGHLLGSEVAGTVTAVGRASTPRGPGGGCGRSPDCPAGTPGRPSPASRTSSRCPTG